MKNKKSLHLIIALITLSSSVAFSQVPSYVPTTGLQAWYPFNGNGNDASATGNNAINYGATFINDRNGITNAAASFNGTSAYMTVATPTFTFTYTGAFSYSFWINKQTQPAAGIVLMTGTSVANNFITIIQGVSNEVFGTTKQQSAWVYINCPHTLNVWDHYVATYNAGTMNFYKNGVFQSTGLFTYTGVTAANLPFFIGKGFGGGNFLGAIDDIGVWNRALTQQEITTLYTGITGINDPSAANNFSISPSSAAGVINIHASQNLIGSQYAIYDQSGKQAYSGRINSTSALINVNPLSNGIYFYSLITGGKKAATKKMVVAK